MDLTRSTVICASRLSAPERKAVAMLSEEVEKRSGIKWATLEEWPAGDGPLIIVAVQTDRGALEKLGRAVSLPPPMEGAEGYRLCVRQAGNRVVVCVVGNDSRGLLFGVGRLLRELRVTSGRVSLAEQLEILTVPRYPLRGHQLGYRPKCNSYDAWDLPVWEQQFRDLAVFGCNAVELIPPRSDDDAESPHFPKPPMVMMEGMSRLAADYGLDVWIWYPALDRDYADAATLEKALAEWGEVFSRLPRIDAVFVPGGDPGHTQPSVLLELLEKQTANLHRHHPRAQMWVSPQGFNQTWMDEFVAFLTDRKPEWLSGIVYGPQVRLSLSELRRIIPARYPIRNYPDITHSRQCQYPVPDWDVAYAVTLGRECINPQPERQAHIFRQTQSDTIGFITYSEGCNDDVNKVIWSVLGWDPNTNPSEVLQQYARYFIGGGQSAEFAEGLRDLERNWQGRLQTDNQVERTLARFQALERAASPVQLRNWRFQQALFRAYYDAYVQRRLIYEAGLETRAMAALKQQSGGETISAMREAMNILDEALHQPVAVDLRLRVFQLAEALFQSIGMQLSVDRYRAIAVDRGASLDTVDHALNNRPWLKVEFARIQALPGENERRAALERIVNWSEPGPGSFYDDFGNAAKQPHLLRGLASDRDVGSFESVRMSFEEEPYAKFPGEPVGSTRRVSWQDHAESLYDGPVRALYKGLDPQASYRLRVVYAGDSFTKQMRLVANDTIEIHPYIARPDPVATMEFAIPKEATVRGELRLSWFGERGLGGNGRNCQVSEVWLLKQAQ